MARNIGVTFNGKNYIHPGAHARINADAINTLGSPGAKTLAFVGNSEGGEPNTVHWFDNPTDAKAVLRGGDLMKAAELAWSPSLDGFGAGSIAFIRVEPATQATLKKGNATFKSLDWGVHTNRIQLKLEDGMATGSKKLTAYYWADEIREVYDNLGPIFNIKYKGAGVKATLDVIADSTTKKAKTLTVKVDDKDVVSFTLGDGEYSDINKIVYKLNEHVDIEASMVTFGNKNLKSDALDAVENADIKGTAESAPYTVTALQGDILYQTRYSNLFSVEFAGTGTFPENFDFSYLAGATDGASPASWTDQFAKLFGEGVYVVVPLTGDESIHAECARFIESQSDSERNKMMGVYGGRLGETVDDVIGRALTFNSSRAVVAYPGITRATSNGESETLAPYFTAALVAGRIVGKETGDPITLDYVSLIGVERLLKATEIDRLIQAGVTCVEFIRQSNTKGYRIAKGVTTYQVDSNPSFREISMRILSDEISGELVETLEDKFAGGKGTLNSIALIKNEVQSFLDRKVRDEVIVSYDPESVVVRLEGDRVYVDYACVPTGAINFILITTKYYQQQILA